MLLTVIVDYVRVVISIRLGWSLPVNPQSRSILIAAMAVPPVATNGSNKNTISTVGCEGNFE
jgi:hypothetical protein